MTDPPGSAADEAVGDAVRRAVDAFAHALRLSCLAARPGGRGGAGQVEAGAADRAVAAHLAARAWSEEAVRRAGRA